MAVADFVKQNSTPLGGDMFNLTLTTGYGPDIVVPGQEIIPKGDELKYWRGLSSQNSQGLTQHVQELVYPITIGGRALDIVTEFDRWADGILVEEDELGGWIDFCFASDFDPWTKQILRPVCHFYMCSPPEDQNHEILRNAVKMAILMTVMANTLSIPDYAKSFLQEHLKARISPSVGN